MSNKTKDILDEILDVEESTTELVEKNIILRRIRFIGNSERTDLLQDLLSCTLYPYKKNGVSRSHVEKLSKKVEKLILPSTT